MAFSHIRERIGTVVAGQYTLLRMIGEGGMGAVFEATHSPSGRRVAVKLIKPEYASQPEVNARFVQEVHTVARIGHPNIVQMLDAGTDDDGPYLVLELLEGETLCDLIDRRPLGFREALAVVAETLDALRAAHGVGIVHRDIKPENIFLVGGERWQRVKLLDFGIAKILTEQSLGGGLTRVGTAVGTPDYMSPEQAGGGRVDPRADLWSLAAVLYECVSQTTPFDGDNYQQLISRIVVHPHTPLGERVPAAPPGLCALIDRALQKDPAQRFANAEAMLAEVRRVLDVLPPDESLAPRDDPTSIFVPSPEALRYEAHETRTRPVVDAAAMMMVGRGLPPSRGPSLPPAGPLPGPSVPPMAAMRPVEAPRPSPRPPPPAPPPAPPRVSVPPSSPPAMVAPPPPRVSPPMAPSLRPVVAAEATQLNVAPSEAWHGPAASAHAPEGGGAVVLDSSPAVPPERRRLVLLVAAGATALLLVAALLFPTAPHTPSSTGSLSSGATDADAGSVGTVVINPAVPVDPTPPPQTAPQAPPGGEPIVQQMLAPPPSAPPPSVAPAVAPLSPVHRDPLTAPAPRPSAPRPRVVRVATAPTERAGQPWTPSEIFQVMRPHLPDLRQCFAGTGGNLQMLFDVDDRGRIDSPRILSLPPGDPRWRCVLGVTRRVQFGAGRPGRALTFFQSYSN
jgi:serine/threonine protein kinase